MKQLTLTESFYLEVGLDSTTSASKNNIERIKTALKSCRVDCDTIQKGPFTELLIKAENFGEAALVNSIIQHIIK